MKFLPYILTDFFLFSSEIKKKIKIFLKNFVDDNGMIILLNVTSLNYHLFR